MEKMLHNLKDYKEAKVTKEHLEAVLKVLNLTCIGLNIFRAYISVAKILLVITAEKRKLEEALVHCNNIIKNKGNKNGR